MTEHTFDENTLRAEIVARWGEYGAHVDVFDHMIRELERLRSTVAARDAGIVRLTNEIEMLHKERDQLREDLAYRRSLTVAEIASLRETCEDLHAEATAWEARVAELQGRLDAVVGLHVHRPDPRYCDRPGTCEACSQIWPCPTRRLATGEQPQ